MKKKMFFIILVFMLFIGIDGVKGTTYTGTEEYSCTTNDPFYYSTGTTPTYWENTVSSWEWDIENHGMTLKPNGEKLETPNYPLSDAEKTLERNKLAEGCKKAGYSNSDYCVRVARTCRYKVAGRAVFCLDGEQTFEVGNDVSYNDSEGEKYVNKGYACALVDLYNSLTKAQRISYFRDNVLKLDEITNDGLVHNIQRNIWSHQYDTTASCATPINDIDDTPELTGPKFTPSTTPTFTYNSSLGMYVSSAITVSVDNPETLTENITLLLTGSNVSGQLISKNNNQVPNSSITTVANNTTIYLMVPVSGAKSNSSLSLTASASAVNSVKTNIEASFVVYKDVDSSRGSQTMGIPQLKKTQNTTYSVKNKILNISLTPGSGSIKIIKYNKNEKQSQNNKYVEGAVFHLKVKFGNKYVDAVDIDGKTVEYVTTDELGRAEFKNLPYGTYKVIEVSAPEGFSIDSSESKDLIINGERESIEVDFTNTPKNIKISKMDIAKEGELKGAEICIYKASISGTTVKKGDKVFCFKSGEEERFENKPYEFYISPGEYALVETAAPEGYEKLENEFPFKVTNEYKVESLVEKHNNIDINTARTIIVYNDKIEVPDTAKAGRIAYAVIGTILATSGGTLIYLVKRRKKLIEQI